MRSKGKEHTWRQRYTELFQHRGVCMGVLGMETSCVTTNFFVMQFQLVLGVQLNVSGLLLRWVFKGNKRSSSKCCQFS